MHSHTNCTFYVLTLTRAIRKGCTHLFSRTAMQASRSEASNARANERTNERMQAHHRKSIEVIVETIKWRFSRVLHTQKEKRIFLLHATIPARLWLRWYRSDVSCYTDITYINFFADVTYTANETYGGTPHNNKLDCITIR